MTRDTLIKGARVLDGTGAPWFRADVRLSGGFITGIGPDLSAADAAVVEAEDRYLAPGFIDAHCHDDLAFLREPDRPEKALQGVTSIVVGNCSFSLYPAPPHATDLLRGHFGGLLGETAQSEVFADFSGYRAALEAPGIALNLVSLVGHAALRLAVMGYERRPATEAEIAAMQALLAAQLKAGAVGLSLGLVYPPSAFAERAELVALAETVRAEGGLLAAHVRSYEGGLLSSIEEFIDILTAAKVPGLLSHLQSAGRPNWGAIPAALARLEAARAAGIDISFDMYPYPAGSSYVLQLLPPAAQEGGLGALRARLADPAARADLRRWVEQGSTDGHAQSKIALIGWGNVLISGVGTRRSSRLRASGWMRRRRASGSSPSTCSQNWSRRMTARPPSSCSSWTTATCRPPAATGCTWSGRTGSRVPARARIPAPSAASPASSARCGGTATGSPWKMPCGA